MTVPREDSTTDDPAEAEEVTMFITVRYGDNKEKIFNPNCLNKVLLANIKSRCGCGHGDTVDLSDEEGKVKNIHTCPKEYGTGYFTNREKVILLKVEKQYEVRGEHDTCRTTFSPLLLSMEEDQEFLGKINPKKSLKSRRGDQKSGTDNKDNKRGSQDAAIPAKGERRRSSIKNPKVLRKFQRLGQAAAKSKNL